MKYQNIWISIWYKSWKTQRPIFYFGKLLSHSTFLEPKEWKLWNGTVS